MVERVKIKNFMKNAKSDPAKPIEEVTIVKDFLPLPKQLVPKKRQSK